MQRRMQIGRVELVASDVVVEATGLDLLAVSVGRRRRPVKQSAEALMGRALLGVLESKMFSPEKQEKERALELCRAACEEVGVPTARRIIVPPSSGSQFS